MNNPDFSHAFTFISKGRRHVELSYPRHDAGRRCSRANGPFEFHDRPVPDVPRGHVLVRIRASGVNPLDTKIRAGVAAHAAHPLPAVLGMDMAGVVVQVGLGTTRFQVGDEVYGLVGGVGGLQGTLAEYASVDANLLARRPNRLSLRESAALPLVSITAWEGLVDRAHVGTGHKVLVHGGAGGVGHVAIQIARAFGAEVYATAKPSQFEVVRSFGATPTPGFSVNRVQPMMGHRGYGHAELSFDECSIPFDSVLGEVGGGFKLIMNSVAGIRLAHIGARAVGMASRVLEMMRTYASERKQFGQPIGDFQMVQQMIADSATEIFATRMMVLNTAWELDQGREPRDKVSMVKLYASEMIGRVADRGIQVFGGMGFCKDLPLERIYRDSRVTRLYDGTSEIHRMLIAKAVIKNGLVL